METLLYLGMEKLWFIRWRNAKAIWNILEYVEANKLVSAVLRHLATRA
jgi:hypothetical protein